jgi:hypothetical protein
VPDLLLGPHRSRLGRVRPGVGRPGLVFCELDQLVGLDRVLVGRAVELADLLFRRPQALGDVPDLRLGRLGARLGRAGALVGPSGFVLGDLDELVGLDRLLIGGPRELFDLFFGVSEPLGQLRDFLLGGPEALGDLRDLLLRRPGAPLGLPRLVLRRLDQLVGLAGALLGVGRSSLCLPDELLIAPGVLLGGLQELDGLPGLFLGLRRAHVRLTSTLPSDLHVLLGGLQELDGLPGLFLGGLGPSCGRSRLLLGGSDGLVGLHRSLIRGVEALSQPGDLLLRVLEALRELCDLLVGGLRPGGGLLGARLHRLCAELGLFRLLIDLLGLGLRGVQELGRLPDLLVQLSGTELGLPRLFLRRLCPGLGIPELLGASQLGVFDLLLRVLGPFLGGHEQLGRLPDLFLSGQRPELGLAGSLGLGLCAKLGLLGLLLFPGEQPLGRPL